MGVSARPSSLQAGALLQARHRGSRDPVHANPHPKLHLPGDPAPSPATAGPSSRLQAHTCPGLPTMDPAGPHPTRPPSCRPLPPSGEAKSSKQDRGLLLGHPPTLVPATGPTGLQGCMPVPLCTSPGGPVSPPWSPAPDSCSCQWERRPAPWAGEGPRLPRPGEGRVCVQAARPHWPAPLPTATSSAPSFRPQTWEDASNVT